MPTLLTKHGHKVVVSMARARVMIRKDGAKLLDVPDRSGPAIKPRGVIAPVPMPPAPPPAAASIQTAKEPPAAAPLAKPKSPTSREK